jgi:hypothetical protein
VSKAITKAKMTRKAPNIVQAMDHPKLFAPWFPGESWNGWRAILRAAYALPMTESEVDFFRRLPSATFPRGQCASFG